jgi:hypothetical protein
MANPMNDGFAASSCGQPRPFPAIVVGGLIVGVLDLAYAIAVYSPRQPVLIPQTIASGILGLKSYSGGTQTAVLGVVLHFGLGSHLQPVFDRTRETWHRAMGRFGTICKLQPDGRRNIRNMSCVVPSL